MYQEILSIILKKLNQLSVWMEGNIYDYSGYIKYWNRTNTKPTTSNIKLIVERNSIRITTIEL